MLRHPETWVAPEDLGLVMREYRPTFAFDGPFIDEHHAMIGAAPLIGGTLIDLGIHGWLMRQDALKLYELAFHCQGDVLELGGHHGLSTSVLAAGIRRAGRPRRLVSVEILPESVEKSRENNAIYADIVDFAAAGAGAVCRALIERGRRFGLAFVDHAHGYAPVLRACEDLKALIGPGGLAAFHDYNDGRNGKDPDHGVYQAVHDAFADGSFSFCGVYGCTGLFHRTARPMPQS